MDDFAILIVVVTFVLAVIALNKISTLEKKLAQLKLELAKLGAAASTIAEVRERLRWPESGPR